MSYENLVSRCIRHMGTFQFELGRANDPYRLLYLLKEFKRDLSDLEDEAERMVEELEKGWHNG